MQCLLVNYLAFSSDNSSCKTAQAPGFGAEAYNGYFDDLAELCRKFGVQVLCGDFNMALFAVVPELRKRGLNVDLASSFFLWHKITT